MVQSQQFSSGIEVATFVTSSGLLRKLWNVNDANIVSNVVGNNGLSWKVYKEQDTDVTIVAFETAPSNSANLQSESFSSTELKEKNFLHFQFLSTKANPLFSLNIAAVSLFFENHESLDQLKTEVNSSPKLIITGLALGGSIASLFTLLLLDGFDSRKKKPLCITFGSPLIGDKGLQNSISHSSSWNSCFLHVVSSNDPLPRKFITDHTSSYVPFGTFLVCHDTYSTCFENSDSVLAVLKTSIHDQSQVFGSVEYKNIVEILHSKAIWKDTANQVQGMNYSDSLQACIGLQLLTLGLTPHMQQQQQQEIDIITLVEKMENLEKNFIKQKREKFDPSKKLNLMKINMAELEMYKTNSKNRNIGYYDSYKKMNSTEDHDVVTRHKKLSNYWKKMVQDSLMKPQKEGASLRTRWLYGGTTYRRMVEPLEIAQFYLNGGKDYVTTERSSHYKQLEDWLVEAAATTTSSNVTKDKVESILTLDSCFWAYVEEALISCKKLDEKLSDIEKDEATRKLVEFENYVYGLLKEYAVSPEIFLSESSYMAWWSQYKKIKAASYGSKLTNFMSNAYNYNVQYVGGTYKFD